MHQQPALAKSTTYYAAPPAPAPAPPAQEYVTHYAAAQAAPVEAHAVEVAAAPVVVRRVVRRATAPEVCIARTALRQQQSVLSI